MRHWTLSEAIAEEVNRYINACRRHDLRMAHIHYRVIVRLRHWT